VPNLLLKWCHAGCRVRGELRNTTKYGVVASSHTDTHAAARNTVRSLKTDVIGFEIVVFGSVDGSIDWLGFTWLVLVVVTKDAQKAPTSENGAVEHGIARDFDEANVSGELVALLDDDNVSRNQVLGRDACLRSAADHETLVWKHGANGSHDFACRPILPCVEGSLDEPDSNQHTGKSQVGGCWRGTQWPPGDKYQDSGNDQDTSKPAEEVAHKLAHESRWRRSNLVRTILVPKTFDVVVSETALSVHRQPVAQLVDGKSVPFEARHIYTNRVSIIVCKTCLKRPNHQLLPFPLPFLSRPVSRAGAHRPQ
jgi:hypothetical protein